jgi:hypothetical protein
MEPETTMSVEATAQSDHGQVLADVSNAVVRIHK